MTKFKIQNKSKILPLQKVKQEGGIPPEVRINCGEMSNIKTKVLLFGIFALCLFCHLCFVICDFSFAQDVSKEEEALFVSQKAQEDGFYDVAVGLYERFLNNYPQSQKVSEANLYIGQCYFFQNRFLDALAKFETLLKDLKAEGIRDASLYWIAEVDFRGNDFKQAASYYQKIIENFPNSTYIKHAYYSLGWCLYQNQDYANALRYFKTVKEKFPDQNLANEIMDCLYNLKDYVQLKSFTESYLNEHFNDTNAMSDVLFYLAEADYYLGNYSKAAETYLRVIKNTANQKTSELSNLGLGWSYIKLERYKDAEEVLNKINSASFDKKNQEILLLGKGILFSQTARFEDALRTYTDLCNIASSPDIILQAYLGRAEALYNLSKYSEAIELYKEATQKIDPDDKSVKIAALCLAADAYQDADQYEKAIESYDNILKDYPDSLYSDYLQYQIGLCFLRMTNYEAAILAFKTLLSNFPKSKLIDEVSYALGLVYFQKEDYNKSIEILKDFLEGFKDSLLRSDAMYLLGSSLYNLGKFLEAIDVFKEIVKSYSQDTKLVQLAEYEIADCFYRLGNEEEALNRFNTLRSKYPDSSLTPEVLWWLGAYYYRSGKLDLARRYFETIIQNFPQSNLIADAYYALGSTYEVEKNYQEAIGNFQKVINLAEPDLAGQASVAISDIYVKEAEFDSALKGYKEAAVNYPNLVTLLYPRIADIYRERKEFDAAIAFYRKGLEGSSIKQLNLLQFKIAECLKEQNKYDEAIEEYLKVSYLYPEDKSLVAKALIRVAQIYEDREKFKEAGDIYNKVLSMDVEEAKFAKERLDFIAQSTKQ
jgi:tetratricopeptide (TPR) repeat protein